MIPGARIVGALALTIGCAGEHGGPVEDSKACAGFEWYTDADGDGFGTGEPTERCDIPLSSSLDAGDCDDADRSIHPGAVEDCNNIDDDCDGEVDDGAPGIVAAPDGDADGYGDIDAAETVCSIPEGWSAVVMDCDDTDPAVSPVATEVCNGVDDDCDALVDDQDDDVVATVTWWLDGDGDGHGDPERDVLACAGDAGRSATGDDCDDEGASVFPGAEELCLDEIDQDCDGLSDDYSGDCWPAEAHSSLGCDAPAPQDGLCGGGVAAVGEDGAAYGTIQEALDGAREGDAITVCPGTYAGALEVRVSGALVGFGPGVSVLQGDGSGDSILDIEYGAVDLSGLSFESGDAATGGGVFTRGASLCVENTAFAWNAATSGGAIYAPDSLGSIQLYGSVFAGNVATDAAVITGPLAVLDGVAVLGNTGHMGIIKARFPELSVTNSLFDGNETIDYGGLIVYQDALTVEIESTTFSRNVSLYHYGGTLVVESAGSSVSCLRCSFLENEAMVGGGAVAVFGDSAVFTVEDSSFDANGSSSGGGGAIYVDAEDAYLEFTNTDFTNNTAYKEGGAIIVDSGSGPVDIVVTGGSFTSNSAGTSGGAVELSESATLTSTGVDWGSGGTDNSPDDVTGYTFGADATFVCVDLICG